MPSGFLGNLAELPGDVRGPHAEALRLRMALARGEDEDDRARAAARRFVAGDPRFALLGPRTRAIPIVSAASLPGGEGAWLPRLREARALDPRSPFVALMLGYHLRDVGQAAEALAREGLDALAVWDERLEADLFGAWLARRAGFLLLARLGAGDEVAARWPAHRAGSPDPQADEALAVTLRDELARARAGR